MTPVAAPEGIGVATLPSTGDAVQRVAAALPASPRPVGVPRRGPEERAGARVLRLAHGRLTLDELVSGAWAALGAGAPAACPVCDGAMAPPARGSAATCRDCGASLS